MGPPQAERKAAKRRRKSTRSVPSRQGHRRKAKKGFNWIVQICFLFVLIRGLQNLGAPCKGVRVVTFCIVQKVTKKHARTCKKLPVASFCASETAETGRIANGREQGDHVSRSRLRPATSIQSSAGEDFSKAFRQHKRNRLFAQNGGEKALNRCEVQALQRKELSEQQKNSCILCGQ